MAKKDDPELQSLKEELEKLYTAIKEEQKKAADTTLEAATSGAADAPKVRLGTKKLLKGHLNKVTSVHYSGDNRHCVSGSLDGKLIIWDTWTGNKVQVIPLRSSWVMSVAFSPSGNFVACGGMDNMCTVYDLNNRDASGNAKIVRELLGYEGFLSSCRFSDDNNLITGSGDMKICHWDIETGKKNADFEAHAGDVVSISLSSDKNQYITGSVDKTCKLWDARDTKPKQQFFGHEADVNSVCFHPGNYAFATASEDKTARMYDLRSDQQLTVYQTPKKTNSLTSCGLSISGRFIICGSDDNQVHIWDALKNQYNSSLTGHENRITSLTTSGDGIGMVTSSWDQNCRVWA
ncbi:UNVERIFIED_CONTAM: hypothetical protein PYX00_004537 [Menopon gallinae]|uniref:Guanine nucleotide-binding protein subunit beta-2 n=1 Tax=Menopon gallinae TaxID=328185 RepID=A0AAW2I5R1_9NEOP